MDCQQQDAYQFYKIQCKSFHVRCSQSITLPPITVDNSHSLVCIDSQKNNYLDLHMDSGEIMLNIIIIMQKDGLLPISYWISS